MLSTIFQHFPAFAFSGSRSCPAAVLAAASVFRFVPASAAVSVGCASGVDAVVRGRFSGCAVFSVTSSVRGAFAARSISFVRAAVSSGALLVVCPSGACPVGLLPSHRSGACFSGLGSGSWAGVVFAVGLGGACLVCVPVGVSAPVWLSVRSSVVHSSVLGVWYFVPPVQSVSLF